jgi:hypothetical protein
MTYPGMSPSSSPMPSSDPLLPPNLIDDSLIAKIKDAISPAQMRAMGSGSSDASTMESLVEKMLLAAARRTMTLMDRTPEGHASLEKLAARLADADRTLGGPPVPADHRAMDTQVSSEPPLVRAPSAPQEGAPSASPGFPGLRSPFDPQYGDQTLRQRYQEGRGQTMGGLARRAAGALSTTISQHTPNWDYDSETGHLTQLDGEGNLVGTLRPGEEGYDDTLKRVARTSMITNTLGRLSTGDPVLAGRIGMLAGKAAGVAGAVVAGTIKAGHFVEGQNEKAASYRSAFGGEGTGLFAAKERFGEFKAGLSGFGTIGGARARDEYRQASALGLRGDRRSEATDFSRNLFMKFGVDTEQSMAIVSQAINQGNLSLAKYAESIKAVSKVAVDSGKTAADAIKDLVAAQDLAAKRGISGDAGLTVATNAAATVAGLDRQTAAAFGGAAGLVGASTNQSAVQLAAARSGQSPLGALYEAGAGGARAVAQNQATLAAGGDAIVQQVYAMYHSVNPSLTIASMKASAKGITEPATQASINQEWAGGSVEVAEQGVLLMTSLLAQYGYQQPQNNRDALLQFFSILNGDTTKGKGTGLSTSDKSSTKFKSGDERGNQMALLDKRLQGAYTGGRGGVGASLFLPSDLDKQYINQVTKDPSKASKAIENLLGQADDKKLKSFTGKDFEDIKYKVRDGDKWKSVSLSQIMKNDSYREQLSQGSVLVQGKGHEQKQISEFTGVDTDGGGSTKGGKKDGGGKGQKVSIEFTGYAKQFLQLSGPSAADRAGMPGGNGYDPNALPPTGGG